MTLPSSIREHPQAASVWRALAHSSPDQAQVAIRSHPHRALTCATSFTQALAGLLATVQVVQMTGDGRL